MPPNDDADKPLVLVTGAAGKIGRHVTAALRTAGFAVRGLTTKPVGTDARPDGIEWRTVDFMTSLDVAAQVEGCKAVIHLAAEIVDQNKMQRVNVEATEALAKAASDAGLAAFFYVSSASVYGSSRSRLVTEDSPTVNPLVEVKGEHWAPPAVRQYARTKLLGERRVVAAARGMNVVIVRPTVVVDVPEILQVAARRRLRQSLVGRRHAHHVYAADVAAAIVWLLRRSVAGNPAGGVEIYNIAEDDVACRSYADITRRLQRSDRRSAPAVVMPAMVDWLLEYMRFGALPLRHTFGRMSFSSDRLKGVGFRFPNGLERLYAQMEPGRTATSPSGDQPHDAPSAMNV